MTYGSKKVIVSGAAGVLIASLMIISLMFAPPMIIPALTRSEWYTEIEATFNALNPEIEQESLRVKSGIAKGIFLTLNPSVEVTERQKTTPPNGVANFTTVITVLNEDDEPVWTYRSHLAGLGRKQFAITLTSGIVEPGKSYTIRFVTRLTVTPFARRAGRDGHGFGGPPETVVHTTRTFERTFTLLEKPSQDRLQKYVEEPAGQLDQEYYYWLLETLYQHKGSYFMDAALNLESVEAIFDHVHSEVDYTQDLDLYGQREHFANASETIAKAAGDCEDKAILFASTLYWKDIDRQARVVAGEILGKGHAWVEIGETVYDPTNSIIAEKSDYYTYVTVLYFSFTYDNFTLSEDAEASLGN